MKITRLKIVMAIVGALLAAILLSVVLGPGSVHYPYGNDRPPPRNN